MLKRLTQLEFLVAAGILATIVALAFAASIMRFFGHPLIWSVDMARLLFIWLCFLGATRAMRQRSHIGIDLLVRQLPRPYRFGCEMIVSLVILVFLLALTYKGIELAFLDRERLFGDSGIPYAWVTSAVPAGCVMLAIALGRNMLIAWQRRNDGVTLVYTGASTEYVPASEL